MPPKIVKVGVEARQAAFAGANYVANAVKATLGPYGLNALLQKGNKITNDGVTIAFEVSRAIRDEAERRGAIVMYEVSKQVNEQVGDGTTTAITLGQAILKQVSNKLDTFGIISPAQVNRQLSFEAANIIAMLKERAQMVMTREQLIESAMVSVEDKDLADMIGGTQWDIGKEGSIIVELTDAPRSSIEKVNGLRVENGFSSAIIINNPEKESFEIQDVPCIITSHPVNELAPIKPVIDELLRQGKRDIVVIAHAFSNEAIQAMLANHSKGVRLYPINAPHYMQKDILKDMAAVLKATVIEKDARPLADITMDDVGFIKSLVAERFSSVYTGEGDPSARIRELELQRSGNITPHERTLIDRRLAQLKGGFAILRIGATSEAERSYKKDKADDAVNAVRAALQEGVVAGAGIAFKEIAETLPDDYLLKKALPAVYTQIMSTAPEAFTIEPWVRDPVKVLRIALEKACSVAGTLASINVIVADENPKQLPQQE